MGNYLEKFRGIARNITVIQPWKSKEISKRSSFYDFMSRISNEQPEVAGFKHITGMGITLTKLGHLNGSGSINTEETVEFDSNDLNKELRWIDVMDIDLQKYMDYIKGEKNSGLFFVTALGEYIDSAKKLKEDIIKDGIASFLSESSGYEKSGKPYYISELIKKTEKISDSSQKLLEERPQKTPGR